MAKKRKKRKPAGKSGSHLPHLIDPRLVKALSHVLRQHIMLAAAAGPISPKELSKLLGEGLSQVSYHVRVLHDDCDEILELIETEPRRGAVEHYYRTSDKTLLPARAWRGLTKGLRAVIGAGQASDLFDDLGQALEAGKLQEPRDLIVRTPLVLDDEGMRRVEAIAKRAVSEVEDEQRAMAKRMKRKKKGNATELAGYTFAAFAFETAWDPAELYARAKEL